MTVISKPLVVAKYAENSQTTQYTTPTGTRTILDKCTAYNGTASSVPITVNIVPNGGSASASNVIAYKSITPNETYTLPEIVGHVLEAGGFVSTLAGTASALVIRISGREVT